MKDLLSIKTVFGVNEFALLSKSRCWDHHPLVLNSPDSSNWNSTFQRVLENIFGIVLNNDIEPSIASLK